MYTGIHLRPYSVDRAEIACRLFRLPSLDCHADGILNRRDGLRQSRHRLRNPERPRPPIAVRRLPRGL
jgi:hypothetical protein